MKEIDIIECNFNDAVHLRNLVELINVYITDDMGGGEIIQGEKKKAFLEGLKNQSNRLILFARYKGEYAGLAVCFVNFGTFAAKPFINIHDFVVHPNHRGKKIGAALMQAVIDQARSKKCAKVNLEVREDNHIARQLYKKFGFSESVPKMNFWQYYL
ncbi:MAG: GNAT family N-acetyltransferase [Bacteroidetes bacterium]|jgi:ribosomal protein S18 acetylase RimI-like enzyme|nr:GNAT family N-acetyltransferase [Bacteroidota bacterium]